MRMAHRGMRQTKRDGENPREEANKQLHVRNINYANLQSITFVRLSSSSPSFLIVTNGIAAPANVLSILSLFGNQFALHAVNV